MIYHTNFIQNKSRQSNYKFNPNPNTILFYALVLYIGLAYGILKYSSDGQYLGKVCDANSEADNKGTVVMILAAQDHIACCGTTGFITFVYQPKRITSSSSHYSSDLFETGPVGIPVVVEAHPRVPVSVGCATSRGGLDIFFTADKSSNIAVTLMDAGRCVKTFLNDTFLHAKITAMGTVGSRLYVSLADGSVGVFRLDEVFNEGNLNAAARLSQCMMSMETVFSSNAGIVSMCLMQGLKSSPPPPSTCIYTNTTQHNCIYILTCVLHARTICSHS